MESSCRTRSAATVPVLIPWLALAVLATRTERVRLGVLVTPLSRRRPWVVARQAVTVDRLSGGRLIAGFGLGAGEIAFEPFGEEWDPRIRAGMLDEGLAVVEALWSGEPTTFVGRHYRLHDAQLRPAPVQTPRIPVWLAAGWPRRAPLARAAKWDGVYLMTEHQRTGDYLAPGDIADVVDQLRIDGAGAGFEIAFNPPPGGGPDLAAEYAQAGATWWVEFDDSGGPSVYRQRLRQGPPRVSLA